MRCESSEHTRAYVSPRKSAVQRPMYSRLAGNHKLRDLTVTQSFSLPTGVSVQGLRVFLQYMPT